MILDQCDDLRTRGRDGPRAKLGGRSTTRDGKEGRFRIVLCKRCDVRRIGSKRNEYLELSNTLL